MNGCCCLVAAAATFAVAVAVESASTSTAIGKHALCRATQLLEIGALLRRSRTGNSIGRNCDSCKLFDSFNLKMHPKIKPQRASISRAHMEAPIRARRTEDRMELDRRVVFAKTCLYVFEFSNWLESASQCLSGSRKRKQRRG